MLKSRLVVVTKYSKYGFFWYTSVDMKTTTPHGFLLVNKPAGISSFYVVKKIKQLIPTREKIGHAGTLDPLASGLLIIGVGRTATRHLGQFMSLQKTYIATGKLGEQTDSLDLEGTVIQTCSSAGIEPESIRSAVSSFPNKYFQVPPIYSALKHEGVRLYHAARKQSKTVEELEAIAEQKKRQVTLHNLHLTEINLPYFTIEATVSHGTYIRVLVNDIAKKVGSCATTYTLARTAIGVFTLQKAHDFTTITSLQALETMLIPVEKFLTILSAE